MPSTAEYWDVDGFSLNEQLQNLRSWGGSREEPPPLRGSDQTIPYAYGDKYVEKVPGARQLVLDGWMADSDVQRLRQRWRAFRSLLWRPGEQFPLTRRWLPGNGGALVVATGLAAYVSGLEPIMTAGGSRLEFKVTLNMADPFFYGTEETIAFTGVGSKTVAVKGDYASKKIKAEFVTTQVNPSLAVFLGSVKSNTLGYTTVGAGATATVDSETWRATELLSGATTKTSGKVSHSGRTEWLWLPPKATRIDYARTSGTGSASVKYRPAWI